MKNSPDTPAPDDAQPIDEIAEDLAMQDVLPADLGSMPEPPETLSDGLDEAGRWGDPVGSHGTRAGKLPLEDETSAPEILVKNGLDEADEELRELDEDIEEKPPGEE